MSGVQKHAAGRRAVLEKVREIQYPVDTTVRSGNTECTRCIEKNIPSFDFAFFTRGPRSWTILPADHIALENCERNHFLDESRFLSYEAKFTIPTIPPLVSPYMLIGPNLASYFVFVSECCLLLVVRVVVAGHGEVVADHCLRGVRTRPTDGPDAALGSPPVKLP